jgi:hypothetical protein
MPKFSNRSLIKNVYQKVKDGKAAKEVNKICLKQFFVQNIQELTNISDGQIIRALQSEKCQGRFLADLFKYISGLVTKKDPEAGKHLDWLYN